MTHLHVAQGVVALNIGHRLAAQAQCLWRINIWSRCLTINQPVQQVQDVGLGGNTIIQRHLNRTEHGLMRFSLCPRHSCAAAFMLQHKRQDIDHLPVATQPLEQMALQPSECIGHLRKWRTIT